MSQRHGETQDAGLWWVIADDIAKVLHRIILMMILGLGVKAACYARVIIQKKNLFSPRRKDSLVFQPAMASSVHQHQVHIPFLGHQVNSSGQIQKKVMVALW